MGSRPHNAQAGWPAGGRLDQGRLYVPPGPLAASISGGDARFVSGLYAHYNMQHLLMPAQSS